MEHIAFAIDEKLKVEFQMLCVQHGDKMSVVLRRAVENYIASKKTHIVKS